MSNVNQGIIVTDVEEMGKHLGIVKNTSNEFQEEFAKAVGCLKELENLGVGLTAVRETFEDIAKLINQMSEASANAVDIFQKKIVEGQQAISDFRPNLG